jgi:hypothetical protein
MADNEEKFRRFIKKVENKFKKYFVAYGVRKQKDHYFVNIIIDDRDVMKMEKEDLRTLINGIFKMFLKKNQDKIKAKTIFVSDLNESNIWKVLGKNAVIFNVKTTSSFIKIKLPNTFFEGYKKLPEKFKLSDFIREFNPRKKYHRNTYQNWLKLLKNAGFLRLKNKTYYKIEESYKRNLLNDLHIKNEGILKWRRKKI